MKIVLCERRIKQTRDLVWIHKAFIVVSPMKMCEAWWNVEKSVNINEKARSDVNEINTKCVAIN